MKILSFFDLTRYNSFGVKAEASLFVEVREPEEFAWILSNEIAKTNKILILGGGSNILFTKNFEGLIIHNNCKGIEIINSNENTALVKVAGGEIWHEFVEFAIENKLGGIENLSLIPGTVGAAPIQNIGAYGVELKEVLVSLEAIEIATGKVRSFTNEECQFGYRNSIFKNELKDKYIITSVLFRLTKHREVNTSYGAIKHVLKEKGIEKPTIKDVSTAVIEIRRSKLPDPKEIGNAGSFFKNPVIDKIDFEALKIEFPDIPGYPSADKVKVPAAWLIDQCGWKGYKKGEVGVNKLQPLVLVNYGSGSGTQLYELAMEIKESVVLKFGIILEPEPRVI